MNSEFNLQITFWKDHCPELKMWPKYVHLADTPIELNIKESNHI